MRFTMVPHGEPGDTAFRYIGGHSPDPRVASG